MSSIPLISHHLFVSAAGSAARRRHSQRPASTGSASSGAAHPASQEPLQIELELCLPEQRQAASPRIAMARKA